MEQFVAFGLHHLRHGYSRPAGYYLGDIVFIHFLLNHTVARHSVQRVLSGFDVRLRLLYLAVPYLGDLTVVALALGNFCLVLHLFDVGFLVLDSSDIAFLLVPTGIQLRRLFLEGLQLLLNALQFLGVVLPLNRLSLNLQLLDLSVEVIEFVGLGIYLQTQFGGCLIHKVDCLIGQETVGDVSGRECYSGNQGIILDTHFVVRLVPLFQTTQNGYGGCLVGFIDHYDLEPPLECLILFEVLLVLVEGGGTYRPQFATRQCGFQDVGGIHGTARLTRTDQRVYLIDEEDNLSRCGNDLIDNAFQSLLELALVLGACNQRTHIKRIDLFLFQVLGDIATHDTVGKTLYNGGLTDTRLTYQDRVVLGTAA